jgi:ring-1,2-phenylacetyl-CoA epoxidase subunit PaaE
MSKFYSLKIKEIIRETPKAVSLSFEVPAELKDEFEYKAGQYVTLRTEIEGKEVRRAYSLCSAPDSEEFKVTVKEVPDGKFSVLANNKLKAGDVLDVFPPEGKFFYEPAEQPNTYSAFAAGSGITPILAIIKTVLNREPESRFVLVYGNKTPEETIFFKELLELQTKHPEQLFLEFVYSKAREDHAGFGRIDTGTVNYILRNRFKDVDFREFYLCGPEEMIDKVREVLQSNGVPDENIKFELFTVKDTGSVNAVLAGETTLTVVVDDEETTFQMDQKETVLDAALENDLDVPYSCQGGICSSCIARIIEGKAKMRKNQILTDSEIEEGLILTCQAHPLTPVLKVNYDDV